MPFTKSMQRRRRAKHEAQRGPVPEPAPEAPPQAPEAVIEDAEFDEVDEGAPAEGEYEQD